MKSTEAFILEKIPFRESDEIITAFTKELGKVYFRARGIKKPSAKHAGNLQQFNWLNLFFVEKNSLPIVTDTILKESFSGVKKDIIKLSSAVRVAEFLAYFLPEKTPELVIWWLLSDYLVSLEETQTKEETLVLSPAFFIFKLLALHGFQPEFVQCAGCSRQFKNKEELSFSASVGGVLGQECFYLDQAAPIISNETLAILKEWPSQDTREFFSKNFSLQAFREINKIVENFTQWHLGRSLEFGNRV